MAIPRLILYRDAALADASGPSLQQGISVLVAGHRILAIRPTSNEGILHPDARIVDAGGSTIVPGMVDAHSHVTLPGGSHWIDRGFDAPDLLLEVAEHNGDLLSHAGVRWARDVGSPQAIDPRDGRKRALALRVRERWRADPTRPKMRVAGTWIAHSGVLQPGLDIEADDGPAPPRGRQGAARRRRGPPQALPGRPQEGGGPVVRRGRAGGRGDGPRARGLRDRALRVPCGSPRGHRRRSRLAGARLRARFRRGRGDGPPEDVPRQHAGDLPLVGLLLLDHDDPSIRQRRREGAHRATTGASGRERPLGPPRRGADRGGDGLRRRIPPGQPPRMGGRIARRGGAEAVGGPRLRDRSRRRTPRRPRRRPHLRGRPRGLLPRPRGSTHGPDRPLAGVAGRLAPRSPNGPVSPRAWKWAVNSSFDGRT